MRHEIIIALASAFAPQAHASPVGVDTQPVPALRVPWDGPVGRGVGFSFDLGLLGRGFGQSVSLRVPVLEHWGLAARGLSAVDTQENGGWHAGGRLELYGQSPVYLNLVRLSGGGGMQLIRGDGRSHWGGAGQFRFEVFLGPKVSYTLEVGGASGSPLTRGPMILGGVTVFAL